MAERSHIEPLGDHNFLIHVHEGEDTVEIRVHASPDVVQHIGGVDTDEDRIVEATAAYLIQRQRADDLAATLDLDDGAAAYDDYVDDIRARLGP